MANSIEEQIEGYYKEKLKDLGVRCNIIKCKRR